MFLLRSIFIQLSPILDKKSASASKRKGQMRSEQFLIKEQRGSYQEQRKNAMINLQNNITVV